MVQHKANRPQQYIRTPKKVTIEAMRSRTLRVKELTVRGTQVKLKILAEEDI